MEGDSVAENSQEIIFSLHLTQSQTDMESQMPPETSLQMEEIQEVMQTVKSFIEREFISISYSL